MAIDTGNKESKYFCDIVNKKLMETYIRLAYRYLAAFPNIYV